MPQVIRKAQTLIRSSTSSLKDLANLLETDQALAIRVLRMANSAYYSRMGRVSSVQEAAVVLGLKALGELITVAFTSRLLGRSLKGYGLPAKSLWKHSLAAAVGSRMIANLRFAALAYEAFLVGLVHDAGKLILDPYILERKEEFSEYLTHDEQTFVSAEKKLFGFDHAEIAAKVCQKWNFPRSTSIAIEYHHDPSRSLGNKLAYVVHAADQIANCSYTDTEGRTCEFDDDSIQILSIEQTDVELIVDKVAKCVDDIVEAVES
jgi:HD-like signal output (HDOD) protein